MKLKIISPQETITYSIVWLEIFTQQGSFVIQRGHAPTVLTPLPNKEIIFSLKDGTQQTILALHGILEVNRHKITLLINQPL